MAQRHTFFVTLHFYSNGSYIYTCPPELIIYYSCFGFNLIHKFILSYKSRYAH